MIINLFHKRSTDWDSPLGYKQVISHCTRRISLLLTLVLGFASDWCNNNDILLVVGYNYNISVLCTYRFNLRYVLCSGMILSSVMVRSAPVCMYVCLYVCMYILYIQLHIPYNAKFWPGNFWQILTLQICDRKYLTDGHCLSPYTCTCCIVFKQFDRLNFDGLAEKHQKHQISPFQNFALYVFYVCIYVPTYVRAHVDMYLCTCIHTLMHAYIHTYVRTYTHTQKHILTYPITHTHIPNYTYAHTDIPTYVHTHICSTYIPYTHTYICIYVHIYIHTYMYTCTYLINEYYMDIHTYTYM